MKIKQILFFILLFGIVILFFGIRVKQAQKTQIAVNTVIKELQEVSKLETAIYTTEQIVEAKKTDNSVWKNFLFGDSILLIAHGKIVAGVDLSKLDDNAIKADGEKVSLKLPAAEIFSTYLDESKTRVYDRTTGVLNPGDINLESEARQEATSKLSQSACEAKILDQATENAVHQLRALLKGLGFVDVEITTTQVDC